MSDSLFGMPIVISEKAPSIKPGDIRLGVGCDFPGCRDGATKVVQPIKRKDDRTFVLDGKPKNYCCYHSQAENRK